MRWHQCLGRGEGVGGVGLREAVLFGKVELMNLQGGSCWEG